MNISFYKYHGAGNDFILIDYRFQQLDRFSEELITKLCDRRMGIGADGLMLMKLHEQCDFEMIYYNADGSQSLCGNGSRCAVHLANHWGIIKQTAHFITTDGFHQAFIKKDLVYLTMQDVASIKTLADGYVLNTGSPHYVQLVDNLARLDIVNRARAIRYSQAFQKVGINVSFAQLKSNNTLAISTYERGVEAETLSCGTGAVASALVSSIKGLKSPIYINTKGGDLQVSFKKASRGFTDIYLIGPATKVFEGSIDTKDARF